MVPPECVIEEYSCGMFVSLYWLALS